MRRSLWELTAPGGSRAGRFLADAQQSVSIRQLGLRRSIDADPERFRGRSVMIAADRQLTSALAALELDGIARRIVLCTPDLPAAHRASAILDTGIEIVVTDRLEACAGIAPPLEIIRCAAGLRDDAAAYDRSIETEWVLFTSGTTGRPKLALHTLSSLTGPLDDGIANADAVWSSFYDIRRYGGLQILLRALAGGSSMVLSDAAEPVSDFLARAGAAGVTHMSGTPSHWRRALIGDAASLMAPAYVRLSGEACDQAILDRLRTTYPHSSIAHAFASTEAGVAFDVRDGLSGFPASLIGLHGASVQMRVEDGSLRIRSTRNAARYLGQEAPALSDADGFVDTGDLIERRDERYHFIGRRGGIINVGGLKVHPEMVEAVINQHPAIHMSRVSPRRNPITGAIVVGELVVNDSEASRGLPFETIQSEVLALCRCNLAPHEVPALLRQIPSLDIAASGKLVRTYA